jgi:hypothetical protein
MKKHNPNKSRSQLQSQLEIVRIVLEKANLAPQPILPDSGFAGYSVTFDISEPVETGNAILLHETNLFLFYLNLRMTVPESRLHDVAECIARANYGMNVGNFELDFETGVIRFKSSIDFQGEYLSQLLVRNVILSAIDSISMYANALENVIQNIMSPKQAIEAVEGSQ